MSNRRINFGFYHVEIDAPYDNESSAVVDLNALADALPHGSGIDDSWYITVRKNGNVECTTEFHAMDEWGGYCGWKPVRVTLRRATEWKAVTLFGPCDGQIQLTQVPGDILLSVSGYEADYLYERVECALSDAGVLPRYAHGSRPLVNVAAAPPEILRAAGLPYGSVQERPRRTVAMILSECFPTSADAPSVQTEGA